MHLNEQLSHHLETTYVTFPALELEGRNEGKIAIHNPVLGTRLETSDAIARVFEAFRRPARLEHALQHLGGVDAAGLIVQAITHAFIMDIDLLVPSAGASLGRRLKASDLVAEQKPPAIVVFGATTDSAASGRAGARDGPNEIRGVCRLPWEKDEERARLVSAFRPGASEIERVYVDLETRRKYASAPPDVADLGNLWLLPGESIDHYGARIEMVARLILERGAVPAMLGGDHSVTWFVLAALLARYESVGIIHFDAHHDLWPLLGPGMDYITHASPFSRAMRSASLKVLLQLGLRISESVDPAALVEDGRLHYFSALELQHHQPESVFESLPTDIPYYLSFDLDCIDPTFAPETGTPVPGGLTPYQAMKLVDYAARRFDIVGWDVVEVGQREARTNQAAMVASLMIKQLLLSRMEFEPLTTYFRPSH